MLHSKGMMKMPQNDKKLRALDVVSIRLVKDAQLYSGNPIRTPQDAVELVGNYLREMDREVVCVVNLNTAHTPINCTFVSIGTLNETRVSGREIFKASILSNAAAMIIMHNHPSGQLMPSNLDKRTTGRMSKLCTFMGIPLLDHIIVAPGTEDYYSFKQEGLMENIEEFAEEMFEPGMGR